MKLIDEKLGGTTPSDVILKFPKKEKLKNDDEDEFEDWDDEDNQNEEKYWFTKDKIDRIALIHNYLDDLPQVGKVLSFSSIIDVATLLNNNKPLEHLRWEFYIQKYQKVLKQRLLTHNFYKR